MAFKGKFEDSNLNPNPQRYDNLPPSKNPYSGVSALSSEGKQQNVPDDEIARIARQKPRGEITAREMGHIGGSIGGPIVRELIELGKQVEAERRRQRMGQQ